MKLGRNDLCHCGSGRKYKKCHLNNDDAQQPRSAKIVYESKGLLPAFGLPGTHTDMSYSPLRKTSVGPFTVVITLMRPGRPPVGLDELRNHELLVGDSQLLFGPPGGTFDKKREIKFTDSVGTELTVEASCNSDGRLSSLKLSGIRATSESDARNSARLTFSRILNDVSIMYDVPMDVYQTDVIDEVTGNTVITLQIPFSSGVWNTALSDGEEFIRYAALYREGLSSRSNLYSFLCYYKILEAVDEQDSKDASERAASGAEPTRRKPIRLPETDDEIREWVAPIFPPWYVWNGFEISSIAPAAARNVKLRTVLQTNLRPIRVAVAHAFLDSTGLVDIEDPSLQLSVATWLPYIRVMARRSIFERCEIIRRIESSASNQQ